MTTKHTSNQLMSVSDQTVLVSVVMGCFNVASSVEGTVRSIQNQTMRDWELIVVDDGSTDDTPGILLRIAAEDSRIRVITQPNRGLTQALIAGCNEARARYIARQDSGDFSLPERLATQYAYLEAHADAVAVGSSVRYIGPEGEFLGEWVRRQSPNETTGDLLERGTGFVHPSAMFRRASYIEAGGYRPQFRYAQDHDLWYRLAEIGLLGSCPEVLFEYRQELGGVSPENRVIQKQLGELARRCWELRTRGLPETPALDEAAELSLRRAATSSGTKRHSMGSSAYFVGSRLYALGDSRCRKYFMIALKARVRVLRSAFKYLGSFRFLWSTR
ncbi:MAG: glycosyltransferase family 2 protein [Planctomyces sp.]|nr:glycosyltransferase family 2 protein [Planctomyces sp.]